jgi:hypothetical protein
MGFGVENGKAVDFAWVLAGAFSADLFLSESTGSYFYDDFSMLRFPLQGIFF